MNVLSDLWVWVSGVTPAMNVWWLVAAGVVGAVVAVAPRSWRRTRLFATYVHEAGHAVVAILTGRRVTKIRLEADTSGTTEHVGPAVGVGTFLTAFAGYPGPALASWGVVVAVTSGHSRWAVVGGLLVAAGLLLVQHSWRGWVVTGFLVGSMLGVAVLPDGWAGVGLMLIAGYLLLASPRTVVDLHVARRRARQQSEEAHSDADALARQTGVPALIWEIVFVGVCAALFYACVVAILPLGA